MKTIGETRFFREKSTFDVVKKLIKREKLSSFKFWSLGCSTGEEPYSLAIMFYEMGLKKPDVRIYASDINKEYIERASIGIYNKAQIMKSEKRDIMRYFKKIDQDNYRIRDEIRGYVDFFYFNILDFAKYEALREVFKFIFLRNVLIYFPIDKIEKIVEKVGDTLTDGGYLFLGNKEVLYRFSNRYIKNFLDNVTFYKKKTKKEVESKEHETKVLYGINHKIEKEKNRTLIKIRQNSPQLSLYTKDVLIEKLRESLYFLDRESFEYYFLRGYLEEIDGDEDKAMVFYKKSIVLEPEFPLSHLHLGNIYYNKNKYNEAYREYIYALEGLKEKKKWISLVSYEDIEFIESFLKNRIGT